MLTAIALLWAWAATGVVLIAAVVGLWLDARDIRALSADVRRLRQNWRLLGADLRETREDLHQARTERDLARATVRELLDKQAAGHVYLRPLLAPVDPVTEEFTRIVERNTWPEVPPS